MQRYWSSLRYSFLRTLFLLAADYVVILSRSTGILGIPLPVLLSNTLLYVFKPERELGFHKIFFHFEAFVHESTIFSFPAPTCIAHPDAKLLHDYWAVYDPLSDLPCACHAPYNIGNTNIV